MFTVITRQRTSALCRLSQELVKSLKVSIDFWLTIFFFKKMHRNIDPVNYELIHRIISQTNLVPFHNVLSEKATKCLEIEV